MTMHPNDPNYRRELERETNEEGMSTAAWAGIAVAVMVVGGVAMYAFSSHESTTTASDPRDRAQHCAGDDRPGWRTIEDARRERKGGLTNLALVPQGPPQAGVLFCAREHH